MKVMDKATMKLRFDSKSGDWEMSKDQGHPRKKGNYPKVPIDYNHGGILTFKIHNSDGITFAKDNPFFPKVLPTQPGDFGDQFQIVGGGTDTLIVTDSNANPNGGAYAGGDYHYELHFSDGSTLDPIIKNGGCCQPNSSSNLAFYSLGAVALLLVLALVIRPLLARRTTTSTDSAPKDRDLP